jgi:hypothetical protein
MTVGQTLDALLSSWDELSTVQVYVVTVSIMIVASFIILSPPPTNDSNAAAASAMQQQLEEAQSRVAAMAKSSRPAQQKPAWHGWVRLLNFVALATFLISLVAFFSDATHYSADKPILYRFLIGWSMYLCYFFSFSGVSLLYDSLEEAEQQQSRCVAATTGWSIVKEV